MSNAVEDLQQEEPSREPDEALEQSEEEATLPPEDGDEVTDESAGEPSDEPQKPRAEKRISQLTARAHRAEERAEYWRDQALRAQQKPAPKAVEEPPEPEPAEPKLSDFGGDHEKLAQATIKYAKELREYDRRQAQKAEERRRSEERSRAEKAQLTERQQQQLSMMSAGRDRHDDFDDVVFDPGLPISEEVLEIATDMENGADVLYALGKRPSEAARLSALKGRQAVLEMAKFATSLGSKRKKGSGAPPPPNPARGSGDSADQGELRDDLPTEVWIKRDRERRLKAGMV